MPELNKLNQRNKNLTWSVYKRPNNEHDAKTCRIQHGILQEQDQWKLKGGLAIYITDLLPKDISESGNNIEIQTVLIYSGRQEIKISIIFIFIY